MNAYQHESHFNHSISEQVAHLRAYFGSNHTRSLEWRQEQLKALGKFLKKHESEIEQALFKDMGRPSQEAYTGDIASLYSEIKLAIKNLSKWMKPERVKSLLALQPSKCFVYREPYGVVLIIAPWNYPIQLSLSPLIGAIAAGNCAIIKPSELAPASSQLLATLLPKYLDNKAIQVVEGDKDVTTALLAEHFDYIFYTGNTTVGRIVMEAAAKHLTPVTLELGGKSPCIVDKDVDLDIASRRILFGKFFNAGQTCVAPDYLLVHEEIEEALTNRLVKTIRKFYGEHPEKSRDLGRIINARHYQRLMELLKNSGEIVTGGTGNENNNYIAPTLVRDVKPTSPLMQEEIFGPILPMIKIKNIQDGIQFINDRPKPLALYLFSNNNELKKKVLTETSSGGVCINHTTIHLIVPSLAFGGVGESGMGAYHGKASFDTFTHKKSVLMKPLSLDIPIIYPPYRRIWKALIKRLL